MSSIRLSPQYGLNPSIAVCRFCGEDSGDIVLPGRLSGDTEAPRRAVWSNEPCSKCVEHMSKGITFMQAVGTEQNPEFTGLWCVVTEDAVRRLLAEPILSQVLKQRLVLIHKEAWLELGLPSGEDQKVN